MDQAAAETADRPQIDPAFMSKLDGDMKRVFAAYATFDAPPLTSLPPQEARRLPSLADAVAKVLGDQGEDPQDDLGIATRDFPIPSPLGELKARLYGPKTGKLDGDQKPLPVVVFYHGGGWVIGDLDGSDATPRAIARSAGCIVVACSYRLAPEYRFPVQQDDAFTAYRWVLGNAASFGGDPAKVAVMGESAGGNLAINVAIAARDSRAAAKTQGLGEHGLVKREATAAPTHMVLIYPIAGTDMETPSYEAQANALPLGRAQMAWFFDHATELDGDRMDPRLNLQAADLSDLPGTTLVLAELDPLLSEGEALGEKLEGAGVEVRSHTFKGVPHGFFGLGRVAKTARAAEEMAAHNLKRAFGTARLPI